MRQKYMHLIFEINIPNYLNKYRFFDIGIEHNYFDEKKIERRINQALNDCYIPSISLIHQLQQKYQKEFKFSLLISGTTLKLLQKFAPSFLEQLKLFASYGMIDFVATCYSNSLVSLSNKEEFFEQVRLHGSLISELFHQQPSFFVNSELIYSDEIGEWVAELGYKGMLIEGSKYVMAWRSSNNVYRHPKVPLKLFVRNEHLSEDIYMRFSDSSWDQWPLLSDKYYNWMNNACNDGEVLTLFFPFETYGTLQGIGTNFHEFCIKNIATVFQQEDFVYQSSSELLERAVSVSELNVPTTSSWIGEEKGIKPWLGNELQQDAFSSIHKLYPLLKEKELLVSDPRFTDYLCLQDSYNLEVMTTEEYEHFEHKIRFEETVSPFEKYIDYMNLITDLEYRIKAK